MRTLRLALAGAVTSALLWGIGAGAAEPSRTELAWATIRDGVLEVNVSQPVWMQQLQLLKPQLLTKLNQKIDGEPLKDIYLKRGSLKATAEPEDAGKRVNWKNEFLGAEEKERIIDAVETLEEGELRAHLKRLLEKQQKLNQARQKQD